MLNPLVLRSSDQLKVRNDNGNLAFQKLHFRVLYNVFAGELLVKAFVNITRFYS